MKYKNTIRKGSVRVIVFREADEWYASVLEFNIVESGSTPQEAMLLAFEAIRGYVESAKKIKARPYILNQPTDKEYEEMWRAATESKHQDPSIFFAGRLNIAGQRALIPA